MTIPQRLLGFSAVASFAIAVVHVGAIFGGEPAARFFNAPKPVLLLVQQQSLWIIPVAIGICAVFSVFGLYAWSGAGRMRRLPLLRAGLVAIGSVYFLRGLLLVPLAVLAFRHPGAVPPRALFFCVVALIVGLAYLLGTFGCWRSLAQPAAK